MLATITTIAASFVGVVIFGVALILAFLGLAMLCITRKGDRPLELSPRCVGLWAVFIGTVVAWNVCTLLAGIARP